MDINEFVATSLRQIVQGVAQAQEATRLPGRHPTEADIINPQVMSVADSAPKGKYFTNVDRNLVHVVQFDIAVTIEAASGEKSDGKITVLGITSGVEGSLSSKEMVASRIKFEVPIALPRSADRVPPRTVTVTEERTDET